MAHVTLPDEECFRPLSLIQEDRVSTRTKELFDAVERNIRSILKPSVKYE